MCQGLAYLGATIYCVGRDEANFGVFQEFLNEYPHCKIIFKKADLRDDDSVRELAEEISNSVIRIDGLINNAADLTLRGFDLSAPLGSWDEGLKDHLTPCVLSCKHFVPFMIEGGGGSVVNNASIFSFLAPNLNMYLDLNNEPPMFVPAAKGAIVQHTQYLASVLAPKGVRVNAISPGWFPRRGKGPERLDYVKELTSRIPMGRLGNPRELVGIIVFLMSSASSYVTGQNLIVDGGYSIW